MIESVRGIDELRDVRWRLKVRDTLTTNHAFQPYSDQSRRKHPRPDTVVQLLIKERSILPSQAVRKRIALSLTMKATDLQLISEYML